MLADAQKQEFLQTGFIRIRNAFSNEQAESMRSRIWDELEKQCDINRDDPTSWHSDIWPKFHNIKFDAVFDPIGGEKTRTALDELLGEWEEPSNWGQFVVSFPKPVEEWRVPHYLWHTDFGFDQPVDPLPGVLLISFLSDVGPKCGATAAIEGGHHLVRKFVEVNTREFCRKMRRVREAFMKSDQWLVHLADPATLDCRELFMEKESVVNGCPVRVRELAGKTGDIIIGHPWLFHTSSDNCGNSISMRRVQRVRGS